MASPSTTSGRARRSHNWQMPWTDSVTVLHQTLRVNLLAPRSILHCYLKSRSWKRRLNWVRCSSTTAGQPHFERRNPVPLRSRSRWPQEWLVRIEICLVSFDANSEACCKIRISSLMRMMHSLGREESDCGTAIRSVGHLRAGRRRH